MALKSDILEADRWFTNADYTVKLRVWENDGVTPRNAAGYTLSWVLKKRKSDVIPIITKTTQILVTGVFNVNPAVNTQRVEVPILDDDTDGVVKAGVYFHELKRTDPGLETVLCSGTAILKESAHP